MSVTSSADQQGINHGVIANLLCGSEAVVGPFTYSIQKVKNFGKIFFILINVVKDFSEF